jgi:hypothetical protein
MTLSRVSVLLSGSVLQYSTYAYYGMHKERYDDITCLFIVREIQNSTALLAPKKWIQRMQSRKLGAPQQSLEGDIK